MASSTVFTPAKMQAMTVRQARSRRGNALFAARLQAKYGRTPCLPSMDFLDEEATTALDRKFLDDSFGTDKRAVVQIMGDINPFTGGGRFLWRFQPHR